MKRKFLWIAAFVWGASVAFAPHFLLAFDQKSNAAKQEKKDDKRVREAREDVQNARGKLKDAERDLARSLKDAHAADVAEKAAFRSVENVREKVEVRLGKKIGLDAALTRQKETQATLDKAKAPVVEKLKASPEYQAAVKAGESAMQQLQSLRGDVDISDEQRKAKSTELIRQTLAAGKLEQAAMEADQSSKGAREALTEAQKAVSELREKIRDQVDADGEVKQAVAAAAAARTASREADASVAKERREVGKARAKLADREAHLLKAQVQDKKNDGKNKKK